MPYVYEDNLYFIHSILILSPHYPLIPHLALDVAHEAPVTEHAVLTAQTPGPRLACAQAGQGLHQGPHFRLQPPPASATLCPQPPASAAGWPKSDGSSPASLARRQQRSQRP